jgi:3-hydroxyisobutyrate dehydrogenase
VSPSWVGVIGLGNMGSVLAANLVGVGHHVVAHDALGSAPRAPEGSTPVGSVAEVVRQAETIVLSLPNASASRTVCEEIAAAPGPVLTKHVLDSSTIGVRAARDAEAILGRVGIEYFDAPVSGGVTGARARTLLVMYSGPPTLAAELERVLNGLSDRRRRVGDRVGLAQALKLANNFLAATTLAATSEAVAFGVSAGLDMDLMIDVLNASSGQSAATAEKFPNEIVTGKYSAGFTNSLMAKDLALYLREVGEFSQRDELAGAVEEIWSRFTDNEPGADFTRIYPFIAGLEKHAVSGSAP